MFAHPITKDDITAFKKADDISFHSSTDRNLIRATIRGREAREGEAFSTSDQYREVLCFSTMRDYDYKSPIKLYRAFEMLHSTLNSVVWQTIAGFLKEGDILVLDWGRNARSCPVHTDVNYAGDSLHLNVRRGDKRFSFLINVHVGPDNSARMVRAA